MELNYRIYDNSFCINIHTGDRALLVQQYDEYYRPDPDEDGAIFEIVSNPYKEHIIDHGVDFGIKTFINVKSSRTGYIYRVLFNESSIY